MTGLHLSHYAIESELGRGGMGVVFLATDTKLNRKVALKVLPASALASPDDRARFQREAQSAAQLNHPNVCHVYQVDEAVPKAPDGGAVEGHMESRLFIAMEYIEGETLHDYVKRGPMKLQEAVNIAGQVAEALKEAHGKDIVHRDIKSANIMLTEGGVAKVLDFGLAKTNQSTMLTRMGSTLGTVAYMSPEQARGQEVDGRSDLYSLGTLLYEMVAGRLPYTGDYEQAVLYGILNEAPEPLTALRTGVPMQLEWIVDKLLKKEAEYRYQSAAGLLSDLKSLDLSGTKGLQSRAGVLPNGVGTMAVPTGKAVLPTWAWGAVAGALVVGALGAWALKSGSQSSDMPVTRFSITLPAMDADLVAAWTPDGREIYYVARDSAAAQSYVRAYELATGNSRTILATEGAEYIHISPEGRWLVLRTAAGYERMLLSGGQASTIPGTRNSVNTGVMTATGELLFPTEGFDIAGVAEDGTTRVIASRDSLPGQFFFQPIVGQDGKTMFWTTWASTGHVNGTWFWQGEGTSVEYVLPQYGLQALGANGYGVFRPAGDLTEPVVVAPFDDRTGLLLGSPVPFALTSGISLSLSQTGNLIYQEAVIGDLEEGEALYQLDDQGRLTPLGRVPGITNDFGAAWKRGAVVMESRSSGDTRRDLYVLDIATDTQTRLTRDGHNQNPAWSPDDEYVYFDRVVDDGPSFIARRRVDGSGGIEPLIQDSVANANPTLSPDGSLIVFTRQRGATGWDLMARRVDSGAEFVISNADGVQTDAHFSPDGRYVAFSSGGEFGGILVAPLEGEGEIELTDEGGFPVWSADGRYIYFRGNGQEVHRVAVTTEPVFTIEGGRELVYRSPSHAHFDLLGDGTLLVSQPSAMVSDFSNRRVWVVLNFFAEMERLAPRHQ